MERWVGVRRAVLIVFVRLSVKTLSQPKPQKKFRIFSPVSELISSAKCEDGEEKTRTFRNSISNI